MAIKSLPQGNFVLLNAPNSKGERCIYMRFFVEGRYLKRSTEIWVKESDWDSQRQEVRKPNPNADRLNHLLQTTYEKIRSCMLEMEDGVTYDALSSLLFGDKPDGRRRHESATDLISYALEVNDKMYAQQKYGYTCWYNKKKNIQAFESYIIHYAKLPRPTFDDIVPKLFDDYVQYRLQVRGNTSKEGINKTLVPLYAALQYAAKNGDIEQSVIAPVVDQYLPVRQTKYQSTSKEKQKVRYLTPEQIQHLFEYSKGIKSQNARNVMDIFFFSFFACGLRISDIITLEWKHINFEKRIIRKVQVKTKREPDVDIPLSDNAMEILFRWKGYNLNSRFVFNRLPEDFDVEDDKKLFSARNAKDKGFNRILATVSRNAKLPFQVTMHVARHSFAVMSINRGMSVHMLSRLLGHSSILATEKTYAQFLKDKVQDDVKSIMSFNL